ncbi:MAG: prephenate dehydratase [Bryobacteraceae bacterium]
MRKEKIAFQGERGAFSEIAVRQLAGPNASPIPCTRFDHVFARLASGRVDGAVIPIENTLHGSVHENYDHLLRFELPIMAETYVRISHNLIARPGVKLRNIHKVYSHPVALNQCLRFFEEHPEFESESFYDTAGSVKMVMEEKRDDAGAIASSMAAQIYEAKILRAGIEDDPSNFTRFFLLRKRGTRPTRSVEGQWKTSLVFTTPNVAGALFRAMSVFALRDISLAKIESRPLRGKPWEYLFYVDLMGRADEARVGKALGHLAELADFLRVLGSYPQGKAAKVRPSRRDA